MGRRHGLLLAGLAAALFVASASAAVGSGAYWTSLPYPVGEEKQHARASPMIKIDAIGEAGHIAYHTIYRSDQVPAAFAGAIQRCFAAMLPMLVSPCFGPT
jgi:hypothetical protein